MTKKYHKIKKGLINNILFFIVIFTVIFILSQSKKWTVQKIEKHPAYSIATIKEYLPPHHGFSITRIAQRSSSTLFVSFYDVNNQKIETIATLGEIPTDPMNQVGKKFMVVYNYEKPDNCILLSKYPVKDSIDYKRYMEKFSNCPFDFKRYYYNRPYRKKHKEKTL